MEHRKISSFQMAVLMFTTVISSSFLLMPGITTALAGRDMWMTPVVGSLAGYFSIWLALRLHRLAPNGSFASLLEAVLGKPLGKAAGLLFVLFQLHILSIVIRDYGDFVVSSFFFKTPRIVVIGSLMLLCAWLVKEGAEVLARCAQFFVWFILLFMLTTFAMLIPGLNPSNLLPVFERGPLPPIKGSIVLDGWFCQVMLLLYFLPKIRDLDKAAKWGTLAVTAVGGMMFIANLTVLMLLGDSAAFYNYPVFMAARYISLADFFEQMEAMVLLVWVFGAFIKTSVFFYGLSVGAADTLGLKSRRTLVLPLGLLLLVMSFWSIPNFQTLAKFVSTSGTVYILTGFTVFPLAVLVIAGARRLFAR